MVTVIIPAYNRSNDLRQALYSLCAQTKKDFQIIVSDDGSTEDLGAVCQEFNGELNIQYIRSEYNSGCGGNRERALQYFLGRAPTEYLMFLDSDDMLLPQAIERAEDIITNNQADIILTDIWNEYDKDKKKLILAQNSHTWLHGKIYRTQFLIDNNVNFPISLQTNEDLAFNLSLYAYNPESYLVNEELYYFKQNLQSTTKQTDKWQSCQSIDYIEAIYYAYLHFKKNYTPLTNLMINNIINCYNYYQKGIVYNTLTNKVKQHMKKMIKDKEVALVLVSIYSHPGYSFQFDQWTVHNKSLVFFGQTFGNWIMTFFTAEEIKQLIKENNLEE